MTAARRRWQAVKAVLFGKECVVAVWKADLKYLKLIHLGSGEDVKAIYGHISEELPKWLENNAKNSISIKAPKRQDKVQQ